jgi:arylsulfatase A-like enzyme
MTRETSEQSATQPSILLLMCDQLNASVLGAYGGPVRTPSLDRLAREGILFEQATCPFPVCSPTRASIVTGLYPHTHCITHNVNRRDYRAIGAPDTEEGLKADDVTTEKLLHGAGYQTHHYGKWHLLDDDLPYYTDMFTEHGAYAREMAEAFAEVRKQPTSQWMNWYGWALPVEVAPPLAEAVAALGGRWSGEIYTDFITKMGRLLLPAEKTFDVRVADHAVERLQSLDERPFMLTASFNLPHDPNVVPSPYYESVSPDDIQLPATFDTREPRVETHWSRRVVADLGEAGAREFLRIYYASCRLIDEQIGRVLSALDASGRADDTIVIFTADHGDMAGNHGMVWKSSDNFYDDLVRVPLIIRYPRRLSPGSSDLQFSLTDLMPTLLALVGQPIPGHVQGTDLSAHLLGDRDGAQAPDYTFCERLGWNPGCRRVVSPGAPLSAMIRGQGWKYVRYYDGDEWLFDLANDPLEEHNLAADPERQGQRDCLSHLLDEWLRETGFPGAGSE